MTDVYLQDARPTQRVPAGLRVNQLPDRSKGGEEARAEKGGKASRPTPRTLAVSPTFKLVFLTVTAITVAAGMAHIALAFAWTAPTANQQSAFEALGFAWKAGIGAIFGLLGGKLT
jgi:hypothetical protein